MLSLRNLNLPLPPSWTMYAACDTGTYMSAVLALAPPDTHDLLVVETFENYRYVGGEIELLGDSIPEWARRVKTAADKYKPGKSRLHLWCDENSQFKTELANYGLALQGNPRKLELRVEVTREYFNSHHLWLAPWLATGVLAYELEQAIWPDDTNSAGRFERAKLNDHTLDCIEHICSRRPRHKAMIREKKKSFLEQEFAQHEGWRMMQVSRDPHLGNL